MIPSVSRAQEHIHYADVAGSRTSTICLSRTHHICTQKVLTSPSPIQPKQTPEIATICRPISLGHTQHLVHELLRCKQSYTLVSFCGSRRVCSHKQSISILETDRRPYRNRVLLSRCERCSFKSRFKSFTMLSIIPRMVSSDCSRSC